MMRRAVIGYFLVVIRNIMGSGSDGLSFSRENGTIQQGRDGGRGDNTPSRIACHLVP